MQRDLGTASIFFFLYAAVVYIATADWRIPVFSMLALIASGIAGYAMFDVVQLRVEAWLNPWLDPSGRSYQIVQSLLAVANGGLIGRGPGLGNPGLVPISHSDFIFSAISEEFGLVGAIAILAILGLAAGARSARGAVCPGYLPALAGCRADHPSYRPKHRHHRRQPAPAAPHRGDPALCLVWRLLAAGGIHRAAVLAAHQRSSPRAAHCRRPGCASTATWLGLHCWDWQPPG